MDFVGYGGGFGSVWEGGDGVTVLIWICSICLDWEMCTIGDDPRKMMIRKFAMIESGC